MTPPAPQLQNPGDHEASFRLLVGDFLRVCEYIEPTDANLDVYSHRLYELLLRACIEFESIAKAALGPESKADNITGYAALADVAPGIRTPVQLLMWRPRAVDVSPLQNWGPQAHQLAWYRAYNDVKHNRAGEFPSASLRHVRDALAAIFAVLAVLDALPTKGGFTQHPAGAIVTLNIGRDLPFGIYHDALSYAPMSGRVP